MSKFGRIKNVIIGILMLIGAVLLFVLPNDGYFIVSLILCVTLIAHGIKTLIYYFTMARHMVGGVSILFVGIIILQIGLFTLSLSNIPRFFVMMYLIGIYSFEGVIDILRALEEKKLDSPYWKFKLGTGVINILVGVFALVCGVILKSTTLMVYIYGVGVVYSAVMRIISAFRKYSVVYIGP